MSFLIIGGTKSRQQKKIKQIVKSENIDFNLNNPDLLKIQPDKSIGIDQIRKIKSFLSKKSWQSTNKKIVIVYQGETMTPPAQNAFLKTLEEPPPNSIIIVTSSTKNALLPTIISRCQIIQLRHAKRIKKKEIKKYWSKWQKLVEVNIDEKLNRSAKINSAELEKYIQVLHHKMVENQTTKNQIGEWLENLITCRQMINNNVNQKHAVDWLVLKL